MAGNISSDDVLGITLMNLKTLGEIQKNTKVSTNKDFLVVDEQTLTSGLSRWRNDDSREKTVKRIHSEVNNAISHSNWIIESRWLSKDLAKHELYLRHARLKLLMEIRQALQSASSGISALCITYANDANTTNPLKIISTAIAAHMTVLIETIERFE